MMNNGQFDVVHIGYDPRLIARDCVALINAQGGFIHVYEPFDCDEVAKRLVDDMATMIFPVSDIPRVMIVECKVEKVLAVVLAEPYGVAYVKDEGYPAGVYIREKGISSHLSARNFEEIDRKVRDRLTVMSTLIDNCSNEKSLTFKDLRSYCKARDIIPGYVIAEFEKTSGDDYSLLGEFFSDQCTPQVLIYDTRLGGKQKVSKYYGPYYQQLELAAEYVAETVSTACGSKYLTREIVRTALLNAAFYKAYFQTQDTPIRVTIGQKSLQIVYSVDPTNGYTASGLFEAKIHPTNPQIEDIFCKLKLGTILDADLSTVDACCTILGTEQMRFVLANSIVTIHLPFFGESQTLARLRDKERQVFTLMAYWSCDTTRANLEQALALPLSTTNNAIRSLLEKGLIEKYGIGKSTVYRLRH